MSKAWMIEEQFPVEFEVNDVTYTLADNNAGSFVVNNGTSDVLTTSSVAGSNGFAAMRGARLESLLEGVVYAILANSDEAEDTDTYTDTLKANTTLITELAGLLKEAFDSMRFFSNIS